jgi:hypothetical protein
VARVGEDFPGHGDDPDADLVSRGLQTQSQRARWPATRRRRRGGHGGGETVGFCGGRR